MMRVCVSFAVWDRDFADDLIHQLRQHDVAVEAARSEQEATDTTQPPALADFDAFVLIVSELSVHSSALQRLSAQFLELQQREPRRQFLPIFRSETAYQQAWPDIRPVPSLVQDRHPDDAMIRQALFFLGVAGDAALDGAHSPVPALTRPTLVPLAEVADLPGSSTFKRNSEMRRRITIEMPTADDAVQSNQLRNRIAGPAPDDDDKKTNRSRYVFIAVGILLLIVLSSFLLLTRHISTPISSTAHQSAQSVTASPAATATSIPKHTPAATAPAAAGTQPTPTSPPRATPTLAATGTSTVTPPKSYEAESPANTLAGGAKAATCTACSGGKKVRFVGNGGILQFNAVNVPRSGSYPLTIDYVDGDAGRSADVSINGGSAKSLSFHGTNDGNWNAVQSMTITVQLSAGNNTILFSNPSANGPDFDKITVS
jgi:hypothetical protein